MQSHKQPRSRLWDYWRWTPAVGVIGAVFCCLIALDAKRYGWAALIGACSIVEALCFGVGAQVGLAHQLDHRFRFHGAAAGLISTGFALWLLTFVICWCYPNDND